MFEAYSVGIRLSLLNNVSTGLLLLSRQFKTADLDAKALQRTMTGIRTTMMVGTGMMAFGGGILYLISKTLPDAREFAHQLNVMRMAGLSNIEIAHATGAAWKTSHDIMTTSATENLRSLMDLRNVLGSMKDATWALPMVAKMSTVLGASGETKLTTNSQGIAFDMAKALDIIGAARSPKDFEREAGLMTKVMTAFQGRVTPAMFRSVFQYARQGRYDLSDEFKYEILPSLMLEAAGGGGGQGGGSRGVGPMIAALYRITNQGYINKKSLPLLEKLGLVTPGSALPTSVPGTVAAPFKDAGLAARNSFLWATQVLDPAIKKVFGNVTPAQERQIIGQAFRGNQLGASLLMEYITKPGNFLRDQGLIRKALPLNAAYDTAMKNDPETQAIALQKQLVNIMTRLGTAILPQLIDVMQKLLPMVGNLSNWLGDHPGGLYNAMQALVWIGGTFMAMGVVTNLFALGKAIGLLGSLLGAASLGTTLGSIGSGAGLAAVGLLRLLGPLLLLYGIYKLTQGVKVATGRDGKPIIGHNNFGIPDWIHRNGLDKTPGQFFHDLLFGTSGKSANVPAKSQSRVPVQVNLMLDKKKLGQAVFEMLGSAAAKPLSGATGFDGSMSPMVPAFNGAH